MASDDRTRDVTGAPDEDRAFAMLIAPADRAALASDRADALKRRILEAAVATRAPEPNVVSIATARKTAPRPVQSGAAAARRRAWPVGMAAAIAASLVVGVAAGAIVTGGPGDGAVTQVASLVFGTEPSGEGELLAGLMGETSEGLF
jgi:anti-sigma factor RsiW